MFRFGMYQKTLPPEHPLSRAWAGIKEHWHSYGWWTLLVFALVTALSTGAFLWLGLPLSACWGFGIFFGFQVWGAFWFVIWSHLFARGRMAEMRWQGSRFFWRGLFKAALGGGLVWAFLIWRPNLFQSLFWNTSLLIGASAIGISGAFSLLTSLILRIQVYGNVNVDFAENAISSVDTWRQIALLFPFLFFANFVILMHVWHQRYVTPELRQQVNQRHLQLRALRLKSLFDRNNKPLGLYERTESDWHEEYNDPALLQWPISQAIALSEGEVQQPTWWWRYLPDGQQLLSEPFSLEAFLRVPYYFLKQRRKVGGSTPALQAAKNFIDFGEARHRRGILKTIQIKLFEEIPRSYVMSQHLTPREMMATYMATLWSGYSNHYGLHRMSLYYFGQSKPSALTWNQAVVLAASLPNPGHLNPWFLSSCRQHKCSTRGRKRAWKTWNKRIDALKEKLRAQGIKVPDDLPKFVNKMNKLRVLSKKNLIQDSHIRRWVRQERKEYKEWPKASVAQLSFDYALTHTLQKPAPPPPKAKRYRSKVSLPQKHPILATKGAKASSRPAFTAVAPQPQAPTWLPANFVGLMMPSLETYRKELPTLQLAFTLVDARDGMILSQYGGDQQVDMASAGKPVVGSTFKVLTLLTAGRFWPDALPLLNAGEGKTYKQRKTKRFFYHQPPKGRGHAIQNSHSMAKYLTKRAALRVSANIGFVFFSLRWSWFTPSSMDQEILRIGLSQMYQEKYKTTPEKVAKIVEKRIKDPTLLLIDLRDLFGYRPYFRELRQGSLFEAAKAQAILSLLKRRAIAPKRLTRFLDSDSLQGFSRRLQGEYYQHRATLQKAWGPGVSLPLLMWNKDFRMELGLRYIIHIAKQVTGLDPQKRHLAPVMTMTLGTHNASNSELAAVAATVAAQQVRRPHIIQRLYRGKKVLYDAAVQRIQPKLALSFQETYQAMQSVLRAGTAARSGAMLAKKHGYRILKESGAKTGTVQNSKGVSCIGFVGHRAGSLSLSTPEYRRLRTLRLRSSYTTRLASYEKAVKREQRRLEKASTPKAKARIEKVLQGAKKRLEAYQKLLQRYDEAAQRYLRTGRIWRETEQQAERAWLSAEVHKKRASLHQRQAHIYREYAAGNERMLQLFVKWFERYHKERQDHLQKRTEEAEQAKQSFQRASQARKEALEQYEKKVQEIGFPRQQKQHFALYKSTQQQRKQWHQSLSAKCRGIRDVRGCQLRLLIAQRAPKRQLAKQLHESLRRLQRAKLALQRAKLATRRSQAQKKLAQKRLQAAQKRLEAAQKRLVEKTPRFLHYVQQRQINRERKTKWLQRAKVEEQAGIDRLKIREQSLEKQKQLLVLAKQQKDTYKRTEAQVYTTHKAWSLSSSKACYLLFTLLARWKEYDDQTSAPAATKHASLMKK
ncbi:MAG: hypothetical protein H6728_00395 [Myxococcales bacterium]|nr:hypothetical protein [Myxococcales bacterium]